MNIESFITNRSHIWSELDEMLDAADTRDLAHDEVHQLVELYRRACSDLNLARSYTANPELIGRLNQVTGRAYRYVYQAGHEKAVLASFADLVTREIPAAFRREQLSVAVAAAAFLLGTLFGIIAVVVNPTNGQRLIPMAFFTESPRERVARIESHEERMESVDEVLVFGAQLYTHNIKVTFLAFSLGALTIVGGLWMLFYNGVILGAVGAMYVMDGVSTFFFAWVGPHGALELPSIIFGGAAGILAGRALLMPGNLSRRASLQRVLPSVWRIMAGTAITLVFAGLIEGGFSQFSSKSFAYPLKIGVAVVLFAGLMGYLFARRVESA
jgi:uncharacterized membrane protein SpoIIM required for sporulation